jgi:quercetin dioxygenase-like cupin family protein
MAKKYTYFEKLDTTIDSIPSESIVSRTIHVDDQIKVSMFGFAPGQELSEHTASVPAIIQIIQGTCSLTLGEDTYTAGPGTWVHMPANTKHALKAITPMQMLLIMLPKTK